MKDKLKYFWLFLRVKIDKLMTKFGYYPMSTYAENPLLKYPRNTLCFCGSDQKAKACCLPKQPRIILIEQAQWLAPYMEQVKQRAVTVNDIARIR